MIELKQYGCKKMEDRFFGQNRIGIYHEGKQGKTWKGYGAKE
jgi:hypothetical protein